MSGNVVPIRRQKTSEWLDDLARKPFALHRDILRDLAERFRAIEAIEDAGRGDYQLELREAA